MKEAPPRAVFCPFSREIMLLHYSERSKTLYTHWYLWLIKTLLESIFGIFNPLLVTGGQARGQLVSHL